MNSVQECQKSISNSFRAIILECRSVLGSELHYQAMVYFNLRLIGKIPVSQMGMNVKTTAENPVTDFFKSRVEAKHINFRSFGIEFIPDISIYTTNLNSDWRRRNFKNTLKETLYSLEIKASERYKSRLAYKEIETDIFKLKAQYDETFSKYGKRIGVGILIIDTAPKINERMKSSTLARLLELSKQNDIDFWYFSQDEELEILNR